MGVLVLGMHRSGTSALAGALEAMGFEVGPDDDVMPADVGNPEGYFELLSVVRANDNLLAQFGGRWDSPPRFREKWSEEEASNEFVIAERQSLHELSHDGHYVLKDPRISLLLPLWRRVTENKGCSVLIVRDPLEVAASLSRRNELPTITGLALWATYNRAVLRDLKGARVYVCSYLDLIENPGEVLSDLASALEAWGELTGAVELSAAVASIHPDLRRNTVARDTADAAVTHDAIDELLSHVLTLRGRHDDFDEGVALEAAWWESALLEERRLLLQWALGTIAQLEQHNVELRTENGVLWERSTEAEHEAELLRERLDRVRRLVPAPLRRAASKITDRG